MAIAEHVARLGRGADVWNQWRRENPNIVPDLSDLQIDATSFDGVATSRSFDFSGMRMKGVAFDNVSLDGAILNYTTLIDVKFLSCNLSNAQFESSRLHKVEFAACDGSRSMNFIGAIAADCAFREFALTGVLFSVKSFRKVTFEAMTIVGGQFDNGRFRECAFIDTSFQKCSMPWIDLTNSAFQEVTFQQTDIFAADLSNADFRNAIGFEFDDNVTRGAMFSPYANDGWSQLRRAYTGTRLVFNLLFLVLFFAPIAIKTVFWKQLGAWEASVIGFVQSVRAIAEGWQASNQPIAQALGHELLTLSDMGPCLAQDCVNRSILALMLGFDKPWCDMTWLAVVGGLAGLLLLIYNAARAVLTFLVAPLRDEEFRSGHAPRRRIGEKRQRFPRPRTRKSIPVWIRFKFCYGWMVPVHRAVTWLEYIAYGSTIVTILDVARTMVSLPR